MIAGKIWSILRPQRGLLAVAATSIVCSQLVTVAGPWLVKYAIDHGIRGHDPGAIDRAALAFVGLLVVRPILERVTVLASARAGERFLGDLRVRLYEHLQRLSIPFFEREKAGVLMARLTADVQSLTTFVRQVLVEVVGNALLLVVTLGTLIWLSPLLSLALVVSLPILVGSAWNYQRRSKPAYLRVRDRVADTLTSLQEGLAGMRVVQSFAHEREQFDGYRTRSLALVGAWREASLVNISFFPTIALSQALAAGAVLVVGGELYRHGKVSIGTVAAFVLYLASLFDPVGRLGDWFSELQSGRAALTKIVRLLETPIEVVEGAAELPAEGTISVEGVTFAYGDGEPVLRNVTLEVRPGEHLALVGATGAGKSTLAKLLTRAYDPPAGRVAFGGVDLREASFASLRRRIAFLPQEGHLFSGTIADNVRLARPEATDEDVVAALRRIGAVERFARLPQGIETDVQTRGVRLSSGERQLVGLARVALADPAAIVLDEATSSLDPRTEADVERALAAVAAGRTVVTIAHRLSTAERADRVAVMERGRLVEIASHEELVARRGRYAALWASWQAGLEPAASTGLGRTRRDWTT